MVESEYLQPPPQAVYACNSGYVLSDRTSDSMFCQEYAWTGLEVVYCDVSKRNLSLPCSFLY